MANSPLQAIESVDYRFDDLMRDLGDFVRIPSITMDSDPCLTAASWLEQKLYSIGFESVDVFQTEGNPVLIAESLIEGMEKPTVLLYGHYDVQKPDPLDAWESEPFEIETRGDYLYGRGVSDMKGQILAVLTAVEALFSQDDVPVNIKVLFEGNEEAPPQVLETFVPDHQEMLSADVSLNCDAGMLGPGQPTISYGLRGGSVNIIRVTGPARDLHDGAFGGAVENPIHVLCELIAGLHDHDHRITLPNFYDKVRMMEDEERALLAALPMDGTHIAEFAGVSELWGDPSYTPVERLGARPSLNVRLFNAGELKGAIPHSAEARLAIRIVPEQDPLEVHHQLKAYVEEHTPSTVTSEVEYVVGYSPYLVDRNLPAMHSLSQAMQETWRSEPLFRLVGGGIPVVELFKKTMGLDSLLTGFSLPGDQIHGPNERLHIPTLREGISALIRFFYHYGAEERT